MKKILFILLFPSLLFAQSYNDGPIEIQVKLRSVGNYFQGDDWSVFGTNVNTETEDFTYKLWFSDNLNMQPWIGYGPFGNPIEGPDNIINTQDDESYNDDITQVSLSGTNSQDFNSIVSVLNYNTSVVPEFLKMKFFGWEDDNPSDPFTALSWVGVTINNSGYRNVFEPAYCQYTFPWWLGSGCAPGAFQGDDYGCEADPFFSGLNWRFTSSMTQIPPCAFYSHGEITGSGCVNNSNNSPAPNTDAYYKPEIETLWRYTKGTSFLNSINLGLLPVFPISLQHFNSNECYNNYFATSAGNDVIYSFDIANPTGVNISLCGINGAQFDSYLYLVDGNDTTSLITSNDNSCGGQSEIIESLCTVGTYYIVVDAALSSDFGTFTIDITKDPTNTFSVIDSISNYNGKDISCQGGSDGKFYAHVSGGAFPYTFVWSNGLTHTTNNYNDSITGLLAGNYSVIVTDFNGCVLPSLSVTLIDPSPITISTNPTPTSCFGYADGTISVTSTSGGTPSYISYIWDSNPIQTGIDAIALIAGIYTVTVTDDNGCITTAQDIITEPSSPIMSIISANLPVSSNPLKYEVCDGNDIALTASGLASYSWSPAAWLNATSGPIVISSPNPPGITYICTGTDVSGCTIDIPIIVDVVSAVNIYTSNPLPQVCDGEEISIIFYGASTYSWFPPTYLNTNVGSTVTITPQDTITYTITAQNASGCIDETKIFIDLLPAPNINAISAIPAICFDSSVPITASGANSYVWSPSSSLNSSIGSVVTSSPVVSTQYKVVGTALNGCKDSSYTTVSIIPLPVLSVTGINNICEGESTNLLVSGANSYIWSPSNSLNTAVGNIVLANPSTSQTYSVTGIDINQCEGITSHSLSVLPSPNISITLSEDTICIGNSSNLIANGALFYSWIPSSSLNISTGYIVNAMPTSTTTYSVVGTDANNCSSTSFSTINVNPLPILNVAPIISTICKGDSLVMMAAGAQDFIWSPALGLNTTIGPNVIATPIINSFYTITGTDVNGCSDIISTIINVNPNPIITLSPSSADICEGASVSILSFGADSYFWSPAFGLNSTTNSNVIANPNATTNYTVLGTDFNNCTNTTNFQLNVGVNPIVAITPKNPIICEGENISLIASGANQYIWKPATSLGIGVGIMVNATPSISTTYTVIGTDAIGCVDSISTTVSVNPLPLAAINQISGATICRGDSAIILVDMSGNPPWNLSYAVNGVFQEKISTTNNPALIFANVQGDYMIPNVTDVNGCSSIGVGSFMLNILNRPIASFDFYPQPANILSPEITFLNNSIFADFWYWEYGDGYSNIVDYNSAHTYFEQGTYQVSLVVMNGVCSDTIQHTLTIDPVYTLYVPDVFTPNNDGLNDIFYPKGKGISEFEMYIYNRWGDEIFFSNDIKEGWSGKINNEDQFIVGYYSYTIKITDDLGVYHIIKGKVLLN